MADELPVPTETPAPEPVPTETPAPPAATPPTTEAPATPTPSAAPAPPVEAPPKWTDLTSSPKWAEKSPQEKVDIFDHWHADALNHASADPEWQGFKDEFTQHTAAIRNDLTDKLPLSSPNAAQNFLGQVESGTGFVAETGGGLVKGAEDLLHLPEGSLGSTIWNDAAQFWKEHAEKNAPGISAWADKPWITPTDPEGRISPVQATLDKLIPGSTIDQLYTGASAGMRQLLSSFSTPKNIGLLISGVGAGAKGAQVLAGLFTAQGIAQLPNAYKQFQAAKTVQDKAEIATQTIGAILLPAAGLLLHEPAAEIPKLPLPNLDKIPDDMLQAGYQNLEAKANPKLAEALRAEIARRNALKVGPETAAAEVTTRPDRLTQINERLAALEKEHGPRQVPKTDAEGNVVGVQPNPDTIRPAEEDALIKERDALTASDNLKTLSDRDLTILAGDQTQPQAIQDAANSEVEKRAATKTTEPHPKTIINYKGEEAAPPTEELGTAPAEAPAKLIPALLNPDGSVLEAALEGEHSHGDIFNRAANEALENGDTVRMKHLLRANNTDAQHGFLSEGKVLDRIEAGKVADATGQRDTALAGTPLQSPHLNKAPAPEMRIEAPDESTHKALSVTREEMENGLSSQTVMQRMADNPRVSRENRALATIFARFNTGAKVFSSRNVTNHLGQPTHGIFRLGANRIDIQSNLFHPDAASVAIEEASHAIDYWAQTHAETPAAKEYAAEMLRIHEIASQHPDAPNFKYALQLIDGKPLEMVPNLSEPRFFDFMNEALDPRGKSLLGRILESLRNFLGLKPGSLAHSALENLLKLKNSDITVRPRENLRVKLGAEPPPEELAEGKEIMKGLSEHMSLDTPAGLAAKGAEIVLEKGTRTYAEWKAALTAAANTDELDFPAIYKDTKNLLQDYEVAKTGKNLRIKSEIAQATGLHDSAAIMKDNMVGAVSRAEALTATLKAREQGGAAGRKAGTEETKATLRVADRWMAADQERVRADLLEFVQKTLPPDERGRYIGAITRALRRPDLQRGDPATMYRNAFRVMRTIDARAEVVYKTEKIADIKKAFNRFADSPSVDVAYRDKIKALVDQVSFTKPSEKTLGQLESLKEYVAREAAAGRDPGVPQAALDKLDVLTKIPLKDMPTNAVDQLHESIMRLADLGKLKADLLERQWEAEKQKAIDEMQQSEGTAKTARRAVKAQPGEKLTGSQVRSNMKNAAQNFVTQADLAISPTDMIGDMLDGSTGEYNGWWSRNVKGKLDLAHNAKEAALSKIKEESRAIANKFGLNRQNFERIGIKGIINMIGRDRLQAMGVDKTVLDKIASEPLSEGEQAYYDYTRKVYADLGLKIKDLAHRLYQMDVDIVDNYVPLMRDWAAHIEREPIKPEGDPTKSQVPFDEQATLRQLQEDTNSQRRTEQGFLKSRVEGAKTAVKYNAQEVFERHTNDALHFLNAQPVLKMLGEIVATPEFKIKYGDIGQNITHDLLDTVATQGQVGSASRLRWLDWARNSTSKGAIAFRLASNLVHTSQIPLAAYHAGGAGWWIKGLHLALSKEGQSFLRDNAAETFVRSGGEPSQAEAESLGKISKAGFFIARNIDRINSQATFLGRYAKEVAGKGADLDNIFGHLLDTDAQSLALRRMRRAVASPLAKDVPQLISRGKGVGNVSVARSLTQFKNIFLDIWSNVRHDFLRVGVQDMHDVIESMRQGEVSQGVKQLGDAATHRAAVAAALLMGVALETGIKFYVKKGIGAGVQAITGAPPTPSRKDKETDAQQLQEAFVHHVVNRVPLVGNILSAYDYSETGIPVVDALVKPAIEAGKLGASKTPKTKVAHAVRAAGAVATVSGLPGVSQAAEAIEPVITKTLRGGRDQGIGGGL